MPRTFWCFMKKKRGYNLVWHTLPNYFMSQLSWTMVSEKKIMKKGLIVNKGKLQTGLHYSLWLTRACRVSTVGFLSMTENSITFTQKKGKSWVQGELQFITKGQFFSQNLVLLSEKIVAIQTISFTYFIHSMCETYWMDTEKLFQEFI